MRIKAGTTDVSITLRIIDSVDGTPETGVVWNTAGIDLWYRRELAASVDITEATLAALTTAHADGGFLHINDGIYRLDLPDAACASGVAGVQIGGTVTGMIVLAPYIELEVNTSEDVYTRLGAPAGASVSADIAAVEAQTDDIGTAGAGLTAVPWNAAWDAEVQSEVADALAVYDPPTNAEMEARTIVSASYATASALDDVPTNAELATSQAAADDATLAQIALVKAQTDLIPANPAEVGSPMTLTSGERNSVADAILDRDMAAGADSGSATVRTMRQALRFLRNKWGIAAGALTVTKEDDTTTSWTGAVTTSGSAEPVTEIDPAGP